eukprot:CAMPEP_0197458878 /NCGR_PEP_ID=MMETSP1175-20131217/49893_1 /TAXON_ID=1003142 /ORGANISM="Triceratium dubium, Strain CCMP147" /LENGTH=84 /DNA_ID=CAMNT_0042993613 /DNA_START=225 /DNA_END=476 /DNA_ORIENTATION=+
MQSNNAIVSSWSSMLDGVKSRNSMHSRDLLPRRRKASSQLILLHDSLKVGEPDIPIGAADMDGFDTTGGAAKSEGAGEVVREAD